MRFLGATPSPLGRDLYFRVRGTADTFRLIIDIINRYRASQALRRIAVALVADVREKDAWGDVQRIFEWVRQWKYVRDPHGVELLHSPPRIVRQILRVGTISDCDDFTILLASLLLQLGYRVQLRMTGPKADGPFTHIYLAVRLPVMIDGKKHETWVPLDATVKHRPMGWQPKHQRMHTHTF